MHRAFTLPGAYTYPGVTRAEGLWLEQHRALMLKGRVKLGQAVRTARALPAFRFWKK